MFLMYLIGRHPVESSEGYQAWLGVQMSITYRSSAILKVRPHPEELITYVQKRKYFN